MSELVEDGSMAGSLKMQSSTGDGNKDVLLRKLQKSIHFVKTVTSSSIRGGNYMTLPTWFVNEHGDKFQQTIFLRSGLSTELWRVQLYIHTGSSSRSPEVKLYTGWRDFAVFHELILGDDLLFSLRAISEFDVYIFRETSNPVKASSIRALRKRSQDFEVPQEEVLQKAGECSVGHLKPERSERPVDGSSGLFTTKKKVEVEGPIFAFHGRSAAGRWRGTSTSDVHYLVSRNLRDPPFSHSDSHQDQQHPIRELEQVKKPCTGSAQRIGARKSKANKFKDKAAEGTKTFPPRFLRRLNASNFSSGRGAATARLEIPRDFLRTYGSVIHPPIVKLQGIHERSPVRIVLCKRWKKGDWLNPPSSLFLSDGWREFAHENNLKAGQELAFTLTADSFLVVRTTS